MLTEQEILEIVDPGSKSNLNIISNPSDPDLEPELALFGQMLEQFKNTVMNQTKADLSDFDIATVVPSDPNAVPANPYVGWVFRHKRTKRGIFVQISQKFGYKPQLSMVSEVSELALRKVDSGE